MEIQLTFQDKKRLQTDPLDCELHTLIPTLRLET